MSDDKNLQTFDGDNFDGDVLGSDQPVLVDFWAAWCGPCRAVGPVVEELAGEYAGRAKIGKLNVDDHPEIAGRFGVQGIPTLILFRDGKPVDQVVGAVPKKVLSDLIERHAPA